MHERTTARRPRRGSGSRHLGAHATLAIGALLMVSPFLWQAIISLSTRAQSQSVPPTLWPGELQWGNYAEALTTLPFLSQFGVSVGVTVLRVVVQIILCTMAGYAFARMHFRGRGLLFGVMLAILMVPGQIYLVPQYTIVSQLGLLNSIVGIAAPGLFSAFGTFLLRQHFLSLPSELEEAARLDGANAWQVFWHVMMPLSGPAVASVAILTTLASWNDLLWPLVVATYEEHMPLAVGLASLVGITSSNYPVMMAASVMAMAPIMLLFIVLQKRVVDGLAHSGLKG